MKSLTYNPAIALSILLAAAFIEKHPESEVNTTEKKGTDFISKLEDNNIQKSDLVVLLSEDEDSEKSKKIALAIQSEYHDVTKFENQFQLLKLLRGDSVLQDELLKKGETILNFINSPSFETASEKILLESLEMTSDDLNDEDLAGDETLTDTDNPASTDVDKEGNPVDGTPTDVENK